MLSGGSSLREYPRSPAPGSDEVCSGRTLLSRRKRNR